MTLIPLIGHTSFETAYVQDDYPYGRQLRCKRAVWLEEGTRGDTKGRMRFAHRTTNPKAKGSEEVWNKPHYSTYYDYMLLVYNDENQHVDHICLSGSSSDKDYFNRFHAAYYGLLDEWNRKRIDDIGVVFTVGQEISKHQWVSNEDINPVYPDDCIVVDDAWKYLPETGLHQYVLARVLGQGDVATLPIVSLIDYNESSGKPYNVLNRRRLKEVEDQARIVAAMPVHEMSLEHFTQCVLKRFRTFDWEEHDGRSLAKLLDDRQNLKGDDRKAATKQIKQICEAYHAELLARGGEIPEIRETVVEPRTVETMQWLELAFEVAPHCPRIFNPIDIVDQDHGLNHRFVNPTPNVFGSHTKEVFGLLADDDKNLLVNTSRPIPGDYCFESDFRHGIFYAVGTLGNHGDDWDALDAWDIFFVDNRAILRYIDKEVGQYGYASFAEYVADKFPGNSNRALNLIKDIAESHNLPWASRPEPEILLVRDAVNTGINTIAGLVSKFFGNEQYDYTEYERSSEQVIQRVVDQYLLDSCMGYAMQGDRIIPVPDEPAQEDEPMTEVSVDDAIEGDVIDDVDFAIDANQESEWEAAEHHDDGDVEDEIDDTEAVYLSIVLLAAERVGFLRSLDVDCIMQEADDRGLLRDFRCWLFGQVTDDAIRKAIEDWQPDSDEAVVSVAIIPPAAKPEPIAEVPIDQHVKDEIMLILQGLSHIPVEGRNECIMAMHRNGIVGCFAKHDFVPKKSREAIANAILAAENPDVLTIIDQYLNPPAPAVEPDVYVLRKSISEENADLVLFMLQEHGLSGIVAEMFEVKPVKKVGSGQTVVKRSPHRDSVRVPKGNPAEQAQKNVEDLAEYTEIYDLAMAVGPSAAARQYTAAGRKMGNTTVSQIKIAVGKYLANAQIKQWFTDGLITWSHVYAGRGDVPVVVEKLRAIAEKNQGL